MGHQRGSWQIGNARHTATALGHFMDREEPGCWKHRCVLCRGLRVRRWASCHVNPATTDLRAACVHPATSMILCSPSPMIYPPVTRPPPDTTVTLKQKPHIDNLQRFNYIQWGPKATFPCHIVTARAGPHWFL
jgi:hypothetical protein